eukprot:3288327-Prymnesium_polylepis.2
MLTSTRDACRGCYRIPTTLHMNTPRTSPQIDGCHCACARLADFQLVSLKLISERLLLASPQYARRSVLPLTINGELEPASLGMPSSVCVFASPSNPGALEAALELKDRYPNMKIATKATAELAEKMRSLAMTRQVGPPSTPLNRPRALHLLPRAEHTRAVCVPNKGTLDPRPHPHHLALSPRDFQAQALKPSTLHPAIPGRLRPPVPQASANTLLGIFSRLSMVAPQHGRRSSNRVDSRPAPSPSARSSIAISVAKLAS